MPHLIAFAMLLLLSIIFMAFPLSADVVSPYVPAKDIYVPQPVEPVPGKNIGVVTLPQYGENEIAIYEGSEGSAASGKRYFYQPYLVISRDEFLSLYSHHCEQLDAPSGKFQIEFHVQLGSREAARRASVTFNKDIDSIGILDYFIIELIDTKRQNVLWRTPYSTPYNTDTLVSTNATFDWAKVSSLSKIDCVALNEFANSGDAVLGATAVIPSAVTARNVGRLNISSFRDHLLTFHLGQDTGTKGSMEQIALTTTRGETKNSAAILAFTQGSRSSGSTSTTVTSTEKDTRERWIDREAYREAAGSYAKKVFVSTWCEQGDIRCDREKLLGKLFELFEGFLETERIQFVSDLSQMRDALASYIRIESPEEVDRLREASMNPSFSSELNTNVDCELLAKATGIAMGAPEADVPTPGTTPSNTSPELCGMSSDSKVLDKNNISWKYSGKEWVPTDIELVYISRDSFSRVEDGVILETTYSGARASLISIPMIVAKGPSGRLWVNNTKRKESCWDVAKKTFGQGKQGRYMTAMPWEIQLRASEDIGVTALIVNGRQIGGDLGTLGPALTLRLGEYINQMKILVQENGRIGRVEIYTNYGNEIVAGTKEKGALHKLVNIRVLSIAGRGEHRLEGIDITHCIVVPEDI